MKIATSKQIKDMISNSSADINKIVLSMAKAIEKHILAEKPKMVMFFCGESITGDCGLIAASVLKKNPNIRVQVAYKGSRNGEYLRHAGIAVYQSDIVVQQAIEKSDFVVDCIYDATNENYSDPTYSKWIDLINVFSNYVISADCPSGLDGTTGQLHGSCVKADKTIVWQYPQLGMFIYPGNEYCGEIIVENVGLPDMSTELFVHNDEEIKKMIPVRISHSHKGTYGKSLIIAGNPGTAGAALMCTEATMRLGCGLTTLFSTADVVLASNVKLPEAMSVTYHKTNYQDIFNQLNMDRYSFITIGPGLGRDEHTQWLLNEVLQLDKPLLIDADGLFALKQYLPLIQQREAMTIITPHLGEFSRVFDYNSETVIKDMISISKHYPNLVTILKGERTMICYKGEMHINTTGNDAMAKGGSGDVLSGMITALCAQRCDIESVIAAVYLHSKAADEWIQKHSRYSLLATDLIMCADQILKKWEF